MLRSDWGIIITVVGLLGLAWASAPQSNYTQKERYQSYRYAPDKPLEIDPATSGVPSANALTNRHPCQNPKGNDESDLCAQWRAAEAAENSAFWAKWGFWIAVIGSTFLLWQIVLTRQAVEDTGDATEAMQEANKIARDTQRAWIKITGELISIETRENSMDVCWSVNFENVGSMVACNFVTKANTTYIAGNFFERAAQEIEALISQPYETRQAVLIPGDTSWHKGESGTAIRFMPWHQVSEDREECNLLLLAVAHFRLPGEEEWRTSAQSFLIAEKISHVDDCAIRRSHLAVLNLDSMHVRKIYRGIM